MRKDGRWDRHGKPNSPLRNFANAPKNLQKKKKKANHNLVYSVAIFAHFYKIN